MLIAGFRAATRDQGPGTRFAVYLPTRNFPCAGCQAAQGPDAGVDFPLEELAEQLSALPHLSLAGGDPFDQPEDCAALARAAHDAGGTVWCWTPRALEALLAGGSAAQQMLLKEIDVLSDGPLRPDLTPGIPVWRRGGQRLLDVPASLAAGRAVPWQAE